jgi:aspartate aminotransferase
VISFGAGEPDFDTPERIKEAAVRAMRQGHTKYTEVGGVPELRAAVCGKFKRDNGLDYEPADILISCGAKHTLFNMVVALLNPGDEMLVPSRSGSRIRSRRGWSMGCRSRCRRRSRPASISIRHSCARPSRRGRRRSCSIVPTIRRAPCSHRRRWRRSPSSRSRRSWSWSPTSATRRLTFEGRHVSIAALDPEVKARTLGHQHVLEGVRDDRLAHRLSRPARASSSGP